MVSFTFNGTSNGYVGGVVDTECLSEEIGSGLFLHSMGHHDFLKFSSLGGLLLKPGNSDLVLEF